MRQLPRFQSDQPLVHQIVSPLLTRRAISEARAHWPRGANALAPRMATTRQRGDELVDERLVALEARHLTHKI